MTDKAHIETVRRLHRLSDLVRPHTRLRPCSGGFSGLCPFHKEKTASFHVSDTRGTFKCFGCGAWGDIFDFVMLTRGLTFQEAIVELQGSLLPPVSISPPLEHWAHREAAKTDEERRIRHAHEIWLRRQPIPGTLAARYLQQTRGIRGAVPDGLGYVHRAYCSPLKDEVPALIAPLQDRNGHVTAVQQIFLCDETLDAYRDDGGRRIKRTLGAMRDGCVRLGLPDTTLGLAGSVEDALAASALFSLPVWATCGEQRFERVWIPGDITDLVIFADADAPGQRAAEAGARKHSQDCRVIVQAPDGAKDWTQVLENRG